MKTIIYTIFQAAFLIVLCTSNSSLASQEGTEYQSQWLNKHDGHFIGEELWANPIQDWQITNGELLCSRSGEERHVYNLTHELSQAPADFSMKVNVRPLQAFLKPSKHATKSNKSTNGYVGFHLGIKGKFNDYRDSAFHGRGMRAGFDSTGKLFIGNTEGAQLKLSEETVHLALTGRSEHGVYTLKLSAFDENDIELASLVRTEINANKISGGSGLICHAGDNSSREGDTDKKGEATAGGIINFAFSDWNISGEKVVQNSDRTFGPIAFSMYTLDRNTLKMTAQMLPVPAAAGDVVTLEMQLDGSKNWSKVAESNIVDDSRTAHFRLNDWQQSNATAFRVGYNMANTDNTSQQHYYNGFISKEPAIGSTLKVASLSCQLDFGFPHQDMTRYVEGHQSDLVIFTGDQYYEKNAGYRIQTTPLKAATLDYLRKWYQFGWAFRDTYRNVPSVFLVDDHDVFHGNVWGDAGKAAKGKKKNDIQDSGGYRMPASWVNAVQRSMTSHMPDPVDPTPVQQGISVYYTDLNYAGVSFAIIEDRKWKTSPRSALTEAQIKNGFSYNSKWDAKVSGDAPGLNLLGERQMNFLSSWAQDWSADARMKVVVSQTLFSAVQTRPKKDIDALKDKSVSSMPVDEYPVDDIAVQDFDTNGWPQTPRKNALKLMRKASAFHIAGDTHLGVTFQYGIDGWNNGAWAIGSPAISNIWPRRWFPLQYPQDYKQGTPRNLGKFYDGFGNQITVKSVANPTIVDAQPVNINRKAPGYNILNFNTDEQSLEVEAWQRWVNPKEAGAKQFAGWPIMLHQTDNGYPKNGPSLPMINGLGEQGAVLQVINQANKQIEYTLRFVGDAIAPKSYTAGIYTVKIFDKDMVLIKELHNQKSTVIKSDTGKITAL